MIFLRFLSLSLRFCFFASHFPGDRAGVSVIDPSTWKGLLPQIVLLHQQGLGAPPSPPVVPPLLGPVLVPSMAPRPASGAVSSSVHSSSVR